jgi:hypothetical protein
MKKSDLPDGAYLAAVSWVDPYFERSVSADKVALETFGNLVKQTSLGWVTTKGTNLIVINAITVESEGEVEYDVTVIPKVLVKRIERIRRKT